MAWGPRIFGRLASVHMVKPASMPVTVRKVGLSGAVQQRRPLGTGRHDRLVGEPLGLGPGLPAGEMPTYRPVRAYEAEQQEGGIHRAGEKAAGQPLVAEVQPVQDTP